MRHIRPTGLVSLLGLMAPLLTACSSDSYDREPVRELSLSLETTVSAPAYQDVTTLWNQSRVGTNAPVTRSSTSPEWTPPDQYYLYSNPQVGGLFSNQRDLTGRSIDLFFTKETKTEASYHGRLRKGGDTWKLVVDGINPVPDPKLPDKDPFEDFYDSYYAYGFIPHDAAANAEIALLSDLGATFADGAVLTLHGLKPVSAADVCVMIGARNGFMQEEVKEGVKHEVYYDGEYTDANKNKQYDDGETRTNRLRPGRFDISISKGEKTNYLFFLFDHIYSALRFCFKVDEKYFGLRDIVLKKMELKANDVKASFDATITLKKRAEGSSESPIDGNVVFTPVGDAVMDYVTIFNGNGLNERNGLTLDDDTYTTLMGGFVPVVPSGGGKKEFTLRTTYDVYDKKGNLVRKNSTAENVLDIQSVFDKSIDLLLLRGKYYTVNITVAPTYLYVMSEPDLENTLNPEPLEP